MHSLLFESISKQRIEDLHREAAVRRRVGGRRRRTGRHGRLPVLRFQRAPAADC